MDKLQRYVIENWPQDLSDNLAVGLSGGVDSVVLLHILKSLQQYKDFKLKAIHINHGISPNANEWESFCQNECKRIGVELLIHRTTITKTGGESLENNARIARYNYFFSSDSDVITLAHHKKDQVETVLSQIFRGSDLHNIASMKPLTKKQDKLIWRPMLNISRNNIEEYAKEFNISYINDESNFDTTYLRNFIRLQVLPLLLEFDKDVEAKILKLPNQLQDILAIVDNIAVCDLDSVLEDGSINLNKFKELSAIRQIKALNYYIKTYNIPLPTTRQIDEFSRQALESKWDSTPTLKLTEKFILIKTKNIITIKDIL